MAHNYGREKISQAVRLLIGSASIQDRILMAHRAFAPCKPEHDFSDEGENSPREQFEHILGLLRRNRDPQPEEGIVPATVRTMTEEELADVAALIYDLDVQLRESVR